MKKNIDNKYIKEFLILLNSEYVIFLTNKFFNYFNKSLLKYFNKYEIFYLDYNIKSDFTHELNKYNNIIKNSSEKDKSILIDENNNELNTLYKNINKLKLIYFFENNIEPNTLYKKITFSKELLFLSFENYTIKKTEYKLRTFCQIAEKLGAETIKITYDSKIDKKTTINVDINSPTSNIGGSSVSHSENIGKIDLMFKYSNFHYNLNLNKFYIIELIENETEFFISKEEFYADIDLKFLIDARCLNLIQLYNTKIIINHINELETRLFIKALNYGLELGISKSSTDFISLSISINFIDIYKNPECINGSNLYINKEGFWHLSNIIKQEIINNKNKEKIYYEKVINFLEAHLIHLEKTTIYKDIMLKFNIILKINFTYNELNELAYNYFKDNFTYNTFEKFKNIILLSEQICNNIFKEKHSTINKLYFISLQYNKIIKCNKIILNQLDNYINKTYNMFLTNILVDSDFKNMILNKISIYEIIDLIKSYKSELLTIILNAYTESYMIWYGIRQPVYTTICSDAQAIIYNDFENKFIKIIMNLNYKITSNRNIRNDVNILEKNNLEKNNLEKNNLEKNNSEFIKQPSYNMRQRLRTLSSVQTIQETSFEIPHAPILYLLPQSPTNLNNTICTIPQSPTNLNNTICTIPQSPTKLNNTIPQSPINLNNTIPQSPTNLNNNIEPESENIIKYIIHDLLKNIETYIITYYNSNYGGYLNNLISNLLIKYFTIKYDKNIFNIFSGDFFIDNMFTSHKDIIDKFIIIVDLYKAKSNYQQYHVYYTWNDFQNIIKYFEENYINKKIIIHTCNNITHHICKKNNNTTI